MALAGLLPLVTTGAYPPHAAALQPSSRLLTELIQRHCMPDALSDFSDNAGLHLILNLPEEADDVAIAREANARHILVRPLALLPDGGA